uniref:precorrin-6Y C5,15-methyltransferase (decarboxylating) subunit CbiT n=1 Tax=Dysgonomonas gadei TaxID=156974 RepID=UPI003AF17594
NLILQKTYERPRPFGIHESEFDLLNGRAKMITKMPVRLLSLSLLNLRNKSVLWDIGFCTGSVSIEAKMQFPHLEVFSFEKREEGQVLMENNSRKFGTPGINTIIGDFVETDISGFPRPDAVFIGGHGGRMKDIMSKVCSVLVQGGTIVFNSVSAESKEIFLAAAKDNDLVIKESITVTVDDFNAIEVMKVIKNE